MAAPSVFVKMNSPVHVGAPASKPPVSKIGPPGATSPASAIASSPESTTLHMHAHIPPTPSELLGRCRIPTGARSDTDVDALLGPRDASRKISLPPAHWKRPILRRRAMLAPLKGVNPRATEGLCPLCVVDIKQKGKAPTLRGGRRDGSSALDAGQRRPRWV